MSEIAHSKLSIKKVEGIMTEKDWYVVRPMTEAQEWQAREDLVLIARGEELDLPWRRLRVAQLPVFERRLEVGASSASVEGLATLVLSGVYTAYLPEHYARFWVHSGQMQAIRPDLFSYRSTYEAITLKGMARTCAKTEFLARLLQQHQK